MSLKFCPKCGQSLDLEAEKCLHCGVDLKQRTKNSNLFQISDRVKTDADFPERWALKFGKKPKEKEDFQYFKEYELDFPPDLFDPNFLHLKLVHYIEDLNYRIEENKPPINRAFVIKDDNPILNYDLDGAIKGTIHASKDSNYSKKYDNLILGIIFLIIGIALIVTSFIISNLALFLIGFILIAISICLLILFFTGKRNELTAGYMNIYVLEKGIVHFGSRKFKDNVINPSITTKLPITSSRIIISIAFAVKLMDDKKTREDLVKLSQKIEEYFQLSKK